MRDSTRRLLHDAAQTVAESEAMVTSSRRLLAAAHAAVAHAREALARAQDRAHRKLQ